MEISVQQFKHCQLVSIKGKVDSVTAPELSKAIAKLNEEGHFKLALDLSGLDYMSSAGFRALLIAQRACKRFNRGEVVLVAVPKKIMGALELTGFVPLFKIFDDGTAAVGSF